MKKSSVSRMQRFTYSQILCYVLERWIRTQHQILLGNSSWIGSKIHHNTEHWTQSTENRRNSSGIFSQDSQHWSLSAKSKKFMSKMGEPEQFQWRIIFMSMFNVIIWRSEDNERECNANATLVSIFAKRFQQDVGHSSDLGQKQSGTPLTKIDQEENGIESLNWWWSNSENADTQFTEQRVRCLEERSKAKEAEHYLHTSVPLVIRLKFFRTIISVNQISIYGAVSDLCEEYSICQTSTGRLVVAEQSDPFFAPADLLIMTPTSSVEIPAQENLLQKHKERVENLSQPGQLIKVCIDAGFLKTVRVGQYFMTKDTEEFSQFTEPVACREYTLPRDESLTDPKGWIQGTTKIGPVLEVTTSYLQVKHGVEISIESVNNDISHSWVRISHVLNKLVTDLIDKKNDDNEQETSTTKTEVCADCKPIQG